MKTSVMIEDYKYHDNDIVYEREGGKEIKCERCVDSPKRNFAQITLTMRMNNFCWIFVDSTDS